MRESLGRNAIWTRRIAVGPMVIVAAVFTAMVVMFFLLTGVSDGDAQQPKQQQHSPPQKTQQPTQQQPVQRAAIQNQGDLEAATILVRATLIAVHHANVTGNYTVLRDLAAPGFQEKNSAADLALIFSAVRQKKIDLASAVLREPKFTQAPVINDQNMLQMTGTMATKPDPVVFDLTFQPVNGTWRLFAITIGPIAAGAAVGVSR